MREMCQDKAMAQMCIEAALMVSEVLKKHDETIPYSH